MRHEPLSDCTKCMQHSLPIESAISPHLPAWCSTWMSWFKQTWIFARTIFKLFCKLSVAQVYERYVHTWCIKDRLLKTSPGSLVRFNALASLQNLQKIISEHLSWVFSEYYFPLKRNLHENLLPQALATKVWNFKITYLKCMRICKVE